jgi:predicted ATP-grasp superfamily ATP-dependent carboligase
MYKIENYLAIVCIHGIGENGLNIVRALGKYGISVIVIGLKNDINFAKHSKYCTKLLEIDQLNEKSLINILLKVKDEFQYKPILFFDNDYMLSILNNSSKILRENFLLTQGIKNYSSKDFQMKLAIESNLNVPKTWRAKTWEELEKINFSTKIKLIAKPSQNSINKPFKTIIANNVGHLIKLLKNKVDSPIDIIIQEYIEGDQSNIWVALGYRSTSGVFSPIVTGFKYLMFPSKGGVMAIGKLQKSDTLEKLTKKLITNMDYYGIFGLEFKYSKINNKYYFIEMSPRTELFHNMTLLANIDLPMLAFNDLVLNKKDKIIQIDYSKNKFWINTRNSIESIIESFRIFDILKIIKILFYPKVFQHFLADDLKPFYKAVIWYLDIWLSRIKKVFVKINIIR